MALCVLFLILRISLFHLIPKGVASFLRMELLTTYTFSVSIDSSAEEVGATRNPVRIDGRAPLWELLPLEWVVGLARAPAARQSRRPAHAPARYSRRTAV